MTETVEKMFRPDKDTILTHLSFLFADIDPAYSDGYIEISKLNTSEYFPVTDIEAAADHAASWSAEGHNVYTTAAILCPDIKERIASRGGRARGEDFYACNAVWVDLDDIADKDTLKQNYQVAPPNFYVVTGRSPNLRTHLWWALDKTTADKDAVEDINRRMIQALGGDKGTHNCTRLMRIGGSVAWPKKDGRITEIVEARSTNWMPPHSIAGLQKAYQPEDAPKGLMLSAPNPAPSRINLNNQWLQDDVMDMLSYISPDAEYYDWVSVGMALKDYGMPFDIWDAWSGRGSKYPGRQETQKKWESFKGSGTTIGTLYYHAHAQGYRSNNSKVAVTPTAITQKTEQVNPETGEIIERKTFPLLYAGDIQPVTETNDFVEDLLRRNEFSVIYGESNCGKTFFMMDIALKVATGTMWREKRVEQGGVIYAALEGGHGVQNRIAAYKAHNNIVGSIPLAVIPSSINFLDVEGDITTLINSIEEAKKVIGTPQLIVIDTLARAISGGDENSSMDMGQIIVNADLVRAYTGAHISFVHHSGKDAVKGARGHSSLRAAVDTEIEISRSDETSPSQIKVVKQREMEMIPESWFKLERVVLGTNHRGKEVSSCVVIPTEGSIKQKTGTLTPLQQFIYDALVDTIITNGKSRRVGKDMDEIKSVSYDELREAMEDRGFKEIMATENKTSAQQIKSATQGARMALKKYGKINFNNRYLWLTDDQL